MYSVEACGRTVSSSPSVACSVSRMPVEGPGDSPTPTLAATPPAIGAADLWLPAWDSAPSTTVKQTLHEHLCLNLLQTSTNITANNDTNMQTKQHPMQMKYKCNTNL